MDILVKPLNKVVTSTSNESLLDVFIKNEVPISYSCMSGRCGTCRCKILEGEVRGPSAADGRLAKHGHYVLACQSHIESDCTIEIPEPDEIVRYPTKTLKGEVIRYEALSQDVRLLRLKPNKPFAYAPGQFVNLTFWKTDGTRSYSMAGRLEDAELEFHIRVVPGGRVSSNLDATLKIGDTVKFNGPLGASYLRSQHSKPMLCVATGTGLAPMLSITRGALESGMGNAIHLLFGARTQDELYGLEMLEQLARRFKNFNYTLVLDHTTDDKHYFRGVVTDAIAELFSDLRDWRIYLAGSPSMVEAASITCTLRNANIEHIYGDAFYPSGV